LLVPPLIVAMQPSKEQTVRADLASIPAPPEAESEERALDAKTPAEWLDRTRILTVVVGVLGLTFLVRYSREHGITDLNHNVVNVTFLMLGMTLHKSAVAYARAIGQSVR